MTQVFLGIDPGKSGGAAVLSLEGEVLDLMSFKDATPQDIFDFMDSSTRSVMDDWSTMALLEKVNAGVWGQPDKAPREIECPECHERSTVLRCPSCDARLVLPNEKPRMGVTSAFTFGQGYGMLEGFLVALGIPYDLVAPGTWQKALGCLSRGDKNVTKKKAQQLFPGQKVTHYTADALLIAEHCRRTHGQQRVSRQVEPVPEVPAPQGSKTARGLPRKRPG